MSDWGFETRQVHSGAEPDRNRRARHADLPDVFVRVPRHRSRGGALRPRRARQHLHADHEPHAGRVRAAHGRARRRCRRARRRERAGRADRRAAEPRRERRAHRVEHVALRRHLQPAALHVPEAGHRGDASSTPTTSPGWKAAIRPNTKAFYGESIGNPKGDIFDFEAVAKIAHDNGIPLVIDNTLASPYLIQPLRHGANIVVHSATKFIGGHGTSIGGVIVDGGSFDYVASGRFPGFTEPDPSYHGLVFSQLPEELRPAQYILKARLQYQRDIGPAISPFNSFLFLQGLQTLSIRMERHSQNALAVAKWLEARSEVDWVAYPGLKSSKWYDRAQKYAPQRSGRDPRVRAEGRRRGRPELHRQPRAVQPPRQRRRRAQPRDPPREHHAQPARHRRAAADRRDARPRAALGRHRDPRRHPRRPRRRIPRRQVGLKPMRTGVSRASHDAWITPVGGWSWLTSIRFRLRVRGVRAIRPGAGSS